MISIKLSGDMEMKIPLEKPCGTCKGKCDASYTDKSTGLTVLTTCWTCLGTGLVPTEAGQAMIDFCHKWTPQTIQMQKEYREQIGQ